MNEVAKSSIEKVRVDRYFLQKMKDEKYFLEIDKRREIFC